MDPLLKLLHENAALKPAQLAPMLNMSEAEVSATIKMVNTGTRMFLDKIMRHSNLALPAVALAKAGHTIVYRPSLVRRRSCSPTR